MKTVYGKAPVYTIDGIPGYKAGEWPGKMSNKFENTRRIINQTSTGVIFNENEVLPINRKLLGPGPSKEYVFRPCIKMVKPIKDDGSKILTPAIPSGRSCYDRKTKFDLIDEYHQKVMENERRKTATRIITNDFGISKGMFSMEFCDNINSNKLLGVTISKDAFMNMYKGTEKKKEINEFIKNSKNAWRHQEFKKIMNMKLEKENAKREIDYVSSLNFWEENLNKRKTE